MEKKRVMRNASRVIIVTIALILCSALPGAMAAESLTVTDIQPIYVEKGTDNYLVTLKAHVTNNGVPDNISIEVIATDAEGFQLQTVKMAGRVENGKTKVLHERVKMAKQTFEQIAKWELKK